MNLQGVSLPGGAFEQHFKTRPVKIAGERQTGFIGSGRDMWGREARKSAWSEESKRGDGILGTPEPRWWDSRRQERPRLLVPICSLERPLPRLTAVPQYHLSARPIRLWDKAASTSLGPLNTAGGENSLRSLISLNLKRCINPGKVKITTQKRNQCWVIDVSSEGIGEDLESSLFKYFRLGEKFRIILELFLNDYPEACTLIHVNLPTKNLT